MTQAAAFSREVAAKGEVWTVRDERAYPAPMNGDGVRAMPFWPWRSRAEGVIATVAAYAGFAPVAVAWEELCTRWAPGLGREGMRVGVN